MSSEETAQGEQPRPTVFLSYSRADQAWARMLAQALEEAGLQVWWDALIEGGAAFAKSIEAALAASDAVIVLWSRHSVASDWVLDEAAHGRDQKKLVPLSIDGTEPPLGFRQYQSIGLECAKDTVDEACLQAVLRAVLPLAGREASPRPRILPTPQTPPRWRMSRRGLLLGGGVVAAAGAAGVLGWQRNWFGTGPARDGSVAVLPFKNLSGDEKKAYFSDGLSDELRAALARNPKLKVMAEASSSQFRDGDVGAVAIASQLGVGFLLDGSVRWAGETVRVAADLVDGRTGFSRWTQVFERRIDDVFAIQSEIARVVELALAVEVTPETAEERRAASGGTTDIEAFDAFLQGHALYARSSDEATDREALALFDAALVHDPGYAAAHVARALTLTTLGNQYDSVARRDGMYDQAVAAAKRAIELAPNYASAYSILGFVLFQGRLDARAALAPFRVSSTLAPGEATVQARWAQYCARTGREREASDAIDRALSLDRLNAQIHRAAGTIHYAARRFKPSIPPMRKALEMNPKMSVAHAAIGDALVNLGQLAPARAEYEAEPIADFRLTGLAIVEHRSGNHDGARALLKRLVDEIGDIVLYQQAQVLAQLGEVDTAIDRLRKARLARDAGLVYARNDPFLDPLRKDPRMGALLAELGFNG
ncbi:TIR domain-containing protein [Luteimonas vadosa]|uniref:TIR domain-containing protein n=1 Tax=Luteimonas vadosa TaxID=1165507 RepID=A0ABP9E0S1_9GAMM